MELEETFSIYGLISFSGRKGKPVCLISPENKLKFNVERNIYKKDWTSKLKKVHEKTPIVTSSQDDIINFGILCTEKNQATGGKWKISYEIIDIIEITVLQNFDNYQKSNPVEISLGSNKIIDYLLSYKKFKFRFIIANFLFRLSITNEAELIFISCDGSNNAKQSLIKSKLYKTLDVIYLNEIKNWDIIKENSKRTNVIFSDSEHRSTLSKYFSFGFETKNISDLFKFDFVLLNDKGNNIEFAAHEEKVPILNFKFK